MAISLWTKLRHPFTAEDLLVSRKIVSSLGLPDATSQFVLALIDPCAPEKVVYVLAVETLSERSIADVHALVAAANPSSVVAYVDENYFPDVLAEEECFQESESLSVPTRVIDVITGSLLNKNKADVYESRAGLRLVINVFGTTFFGNILAAKKAAENSRSGFEYLRIPSFASAALTDTGEEEVPPTGAGESSGDSISTEQTVVDKFLVALFDLFTGVDSENKLTEGLHNVGTKSLSNFYPRTLIRPVAPSVVSALAVAGGPPENRITPTLEAEELSGESEQTLPSFAVPFYPLFVDLHNLFKDTPGLNQAFNFAKKLLSDVESGSDVNHEDLSRARRFRVAVETIRLHWNAATQSKQKAPVKSPDFSQLSPEEKGHALLAHALQHQAQKFNKVVAIVDAKNVAGIRYHWNTSVPPEVAAFAEHCFVSLEPQDTEIESAFFGLIEKPEAKTAVVVSAGAAAAVGLVSLPSLSTVAKVLSFKVPTVLKLAWLQSKRMAVVSLTKAVAPASKVASPFLAHSSTGPAMAIKSAISAEKARATAHSMVAVAERASFQAVRTAFYDLMKVRQANRVGPRNWLMFGGTLAAAAGFWLYQENVELAIGAAPIAPAVARLGRGLESLDRASEVVGEYEDARWWERIYGSIYLHRRGL